jgi:uroporphyrinogen-III synthase
MQGLVLNSRPLVYRSRFHAAFAPLLGANWQIVDSPVLIAESLPAALPAPETVDLVIFTSQMAAATFPGGGPWRARKVLAVGEATASAAAEAGFTHVVEAGPDIAGLRAALGREPFAHAVYASGADITAALDKEFPGRITRVTTYQMLPAVGLSAEFKAAGWERLPVLAPIFSRRSATILADLLDKAGITKATANVVAIGISADALGDGPWKTQHVAAEPTLAAVAACAKRVAGDYERMMSR